MIHARPTFTLFRHDVEATFLRRPNRFRVEVELQNTRRLIIDAPTKAKGMPEVQEATKRIDGIHTRAEEAKKRPADTARPEDIVGTEDAPTLTGDASGTMSAPPDARETMAPKVTTLTETVPAHCPNPGRLLELLLPGTRVILEARRENLAGARGKTAQSGAESTRFTEGGTEWQYSQEGKANGLLPWKEGWKGGEGDGKAGAERAPRKTEYTLVAAYTRTGGGTSRVVPLYSSRLNQLAEALIIPRLFPDARRIQREVQWGDSRCDFFVEDGGGKGHFLEVKGCTLVEYGVAMFPDAPSSRAVRHLQELADAARAGYGAHVVFILTHGPVAKFIPNLHTDPEFAWTLSQVSPSVRIHAVEVEADREGRAWIVREDIPVDLSHGKLAMEDRGSYLVTFRLNTRCRLSVGSLGEVEFFPGWYVYAGSAQRGLSSRVARHLRLGGKKNQRKKYHWHIDYLSAVAEEALAYPIASYRNLECDLAKGLAEIGGKPIEGFGSSDCSCGSHLFYFADPRAPQDTWQFVDLVLRFRHLVFSE